MLKLTNPVQDVNRTTTRFLAKAVVCLALCISPGVVLARSGGPPKVLRTLYEEVCKETPMKRADAEFEKDPRAWIAAHREDVTPRAIEIAKGQHDDINWMRVLSLVAILQSQELEAVFLERCRNTQDKQQLSSIVSTLGIAGYGPARVFIEEIVLVPDQDYSLRKSGILALGRIGDDESARILEQLDARLVAGNKDINSAYARLDIRRTIDRIRGIVRVAKTKYDQSTPQAAARALIDTVRLKDWEGFVDLAPAVIRIGYEHEDPAAQALLGRLFDYAEAQQILQEIEKKLDTATIQKLDRPTAVGGSTVLKIDGGHGIELIKEDGVWKIVTFR